MADHSTFQLDAAVYAELVAMVGENNLCRETVEENGDVWSKLTTDDAWDSAFTYHTAPAVLAAFNEFGDDDGATKELYDCINKALKHLQSVDAATDFLCTLIAGSDLAETKRPLSVTKRTA